MFVMEAPVTLKYIKTLFRNSFEILIFVIILAVKWGEKQVHLSQKHDS